MIPSLSFFQENLESRIIKDLSLFWANYLKKNHLPGRCEIGPENQQLPQLSKGGGSLTSRLLVVRSFASRSIPHVSWLCQCGAQ